MLSRSNSFDVDNTPRGLVHYTLWCTYDLSHEEIVRFVENWLRKRAPQVRRWNYDDNTGERSFQLFHVHVYIETHPYSYFPDAQKAYFPNHHCYINPSNTHSLMNKCS